MTKLNKIQFAEISYHLLTELERGKSVAEQIGAILYWSGGWSASSLVLVHAGG